MSVADSNCEIFKDCLSSAILEKYSSGTPKRMAKRSRKSARAAPSSSQTVTGDGEIDPAELAEFIEVNTKHSYPKRTFSSYLISEVRV